MRSKAGKTNMIEYRDKNTCQIMYWYEMREITFSQAQVKWLMPYLPALKEGHYPAQPIGYNTCDVRSTGNKSASFTRPCEIAGEIEARLYKCSFDGLITLNYFTYEMPVIELMRYVNQGPEEVHKRINRCVKFISGKKRKNIDYRDWCNHKKA